MISARVGLSYAMAAAMAFCEAATSVRAASDADKALLAKVAAQIYAAAALQDKPVEGFPEAFAVAKPGPRWAWPPLVAISSDDEVNAFATIIIVDEGEKPIIYGEPGVQWVDVPGFDSKRSDPSSKAVAEDSAIDEVLEGEGAKRFIQPVMLFKQGYMDTIVKGREGPLAGCFGHELAHHLLKHTLTYPSGTPLIQFAAIRQQEADADALGTEVALRAKIDYDSIVAGARVEREDGYRCSFLGMNSDHPGWNDRLALIDGRQRDRWRSIDAFENGVHFLMTEQYVYAEKCFAEVIRKEPKCYEAWANKGYAELMQFCDGLDASDLKEFDLGQLVVGGFYARPGTLEGTREINVDMWFAAVGDLRQALLLKPDLVMAKANLAAAWLLCPEGKETGKAEALFTEVRNALKSGQYDEEINPLVHAALLVNAGVAESAGGDSSAAEELLDEARKIIARADKGQGALVGNAIRFNRARLLAARDESAPRMSAIEELEAYLSSGSPAATWWSIAYEQYEKLCREAGIEAKTEAKLARASNTQYRAVAGVELGGGETVALNEPVEQITKLLGDGVQQTLIEKTNLHRRRYADKGLDLVCNNRVLAIRLQGLQAPPLVLRASGASHESHELRPGMTVDELNSALGGDAKEWDLRYGASSAVVYRFYGRLGFGVRLTDEGRVMEIIVAQIPYAAVVKD